MNKQSGFTLIELVIVIVILGILAATAAPKFIDLQSDAKTATLQGVTASLKSAASMIHSKSLIKGNQGVVKATTVNILVNGVVLDINYGYPLTDYSSATGAGTWANLIELDGGFTAEVVTISSVKYYVVYPANGVTPTVIPAILSAPDITLTTPESTCFSFYQEVTTLGGTPSIATVPCL